MVDIVLIIVGAILILIGIIGCIAPVIPGPPISYIGLLMLQFTKNSSLSTTTMIILGVLTVVITVLDYIIPSLGTKKFGGTKGGVWGSTIGIILGMFIIPPIGLFVMPFVGAFIGELIYGKTTKKALRAALGSFIGFLSGAFMKIILCIVILITFIYGLL